MKSSRQLVYGVLVGVVVVLAGCRPANTAAGNPDDAVRPDVPADSNPTAPSAGPEIAPSATAPLHPPELTPTPCEDPFAGVQVRFRPEHWPTTDFCKHSVDYSEFLSGGPPPDGIPAIDDPLFESVTEAGTWLGASWPVLMFEHNGDARAYPLAILIWHEIVNDVVGGKPVSLTFCPLCNATVVFDRELPDGTVLDFGTSGNLRKSDLVMYDRQTRSWWQQFTGEAIVGAFTGTRLAFLPSQILPWEAFATAYPEGLVLSRETGHPRSYGRNPYIGYDDVNTNPFLFDGVVDGRLPATARVAAVEIGSSWVAYPFTELEKTGVANDWVEGRAIVVFWQPGATSALDAASFDDARDVGSTGVFSSELNGTVLNFRTVDGGFEDLETGSLWNILGVAIEGQLTGSQLDRIVAAEHFWFAWAAFRPDTLIWQSQVQP